MFEKDSNNSGVMCDLFKLIPLTLEYCEQVYEIARECLPEHWSLDGIRDVLKYDNNIYYVAVLSQDKIYHEKVSGNYACVKVDEFGKADEPGKDDEPVKVDESDKAGIMNIKLKTVIGFGGIMIVADEAELLNIAVTEKYRGMNIASALMDRLIYEAKAKACARMLLEVRHSNEVAQRLYKKKRFDELGVRKNYYDNPTEDAIIMERKLL
ncbi:MAG: ribosomal protein S18-alanine N-acetyltransferase [Lachnospiraceae bacterium]|nr:ribosomal protein S18-alanine N-acetyltransferase [Lachnospiraceae bacterium]